MKTKASILALFFLSTIISSCAKKDIEHKEKETTGFTELVVPADFNWKMSENVTCNFTSFPREQTQLLLPRSMSDRM